MIEHTQCGVKSTCAFFVLVTYVVLSLAACAPSDTEHSRLFGLGMLVVAIAIVHRVKSKPTMIML